MAWLQTVEIFPPGIDPTMIDAPGSRNPGWHVAQAVNGDSREADAPAHVTIHAKHAPKPAYPAEILDDSSYDLACESSTCE